MNTRNVQKKTQKKGVVMLSKEKKQRFFVCVRVCATIKKKEVLTSINFLKGGYLVNRS